MLCRSRLRFRPNNSLRLPYQRPYRRFTTHSSSLASSSGQGQNSFAALGGLVSELDRLSPRFEIEAKDIDIIQNPADFYASLKTKILKAKQRIFLSTLYIGKTEHELIETLCQALRQNPNVKLSILTDALRGTRESPSQSCASLLVPLVGEFGSERVEIRMFHTPNLTGLRKAVIPKRINEGWGLQHMKLYGIDDELMLSGANLSEDYFTNRQDRYHVFKSANITNYFQMIHSSVCRLSFNILPSQEQQGYTMTWPTTNAAVSPLESSSKFKESATALLAPLIKPTIPTGANSQSSGSTLVYPLLQFTPLLRPDTSTELPTLQLILQSLASAPLQNCSWTFTAGYFNMTTSVRRLLLGTNPIHGTVIAASPWANGFYGSAGISGMLPDAYTLLSKRFVDAVRRKDLSSQITVKEWRRGTVNKPEGWTYHAKGLWITLPKEEAPSMTIIGSSNYTKRSYELDLEANVLIVTRDEELKKKLASEEKWLQDYAKAVGSEEYAKPERQVGIKVRLAMWAVRVLGGAL